MDSATNDEPIDAMDEPASQRLPLPQPPGSRVEIERFADGLTMRVPAAGLLRGTQGLFVFAVIWNSFLTVIMALMVASLAKAGQAGPKADHSDWFPMGIFSLFWLVGIGLLLGSIHMGRRQAAIAVTGGSLMLIQTGLFGTRQRTWPPGEVATICAGPSGMTVNDRPVLELQILDSQQRKFGLLAGRANDELCWIAQELRQALQVREPTDEA